MIKKEYDLIHKWIKRHYGKACKCESDNCQNKPKRFEWALKKGFNYERNIENFIQLCPSCHRKYDLTEKMIDRLKKNRKTSVHQKPIEKIQIAGQIFNSTKDAADVLGINRMGIYNVLAGKAQRVGGFTVTKI